MRTVAREEGHMRDQRSSGLRALAVIVVFFMAVSVILLVIVLGRGKCLAVVL